MDDRPREQSWGRLAKGQILAQAKVVQWFKLLGQVVSE